jgi:rhamnose transport system ATP-binding protein
MTPEFGVIMKSNVLLRLNKITKRFPGVIAVNNVDFELKEGEVHGIIGENGAGKSTLIKIITGVYQPDSGEIFLNNRSVKFHNPVVAHEHGIAAIYQEPVIFPDLNVTENLFMGHYKVGANFRKVSWKYMHEEAKKILESLGVDIDPRSGVKGLSVGKLQIIEIAKALTMNTRILIMDEPTSALTYHETEELFEIVRTLRKRGTTFIFISHRLDDIYKIADRVTILRDGRYITTKNVTEVKKDELIQLMVGREVSNLFPKLDVEIGEEILRVENFTHLGKFRDISFSLHAGEILGFAGLVGAGRTEVAEALFGIDPPDAGKIWINNRKVSIASPVEAMNFGIAYLPEDRQAHGLLLTMSILKNITLPSLKNHAQTGWIDGKAERETAEEYSGMLEVKARNVFQSVSQLSGGNQQKVVLAKWLAIEPKILILDEPTKGIDVGSKAYIHRFMSELASRGVGIIMVSSELPEIIGMSDNIVVMHEGRITKYIPRSEANEESVLKAAINE